ncbi:adenylyl-sulfate kinase [Nocardioides houyundeii]|uniref:adenylyl-sulfate kinase n=1 Tax=Nocardioides houyundeii TaxID=2045452 RepID=UPI001F07C71C|nr:adenylyl-sulfate kinase [Nocardioides houyundeii]
MSASSLPQHCPTPVELDDLELLLSGALAPLTGFNEPGSVVTLTLPPALATLDAVELVDPEGLPLALVSLVEERAPASVSKPLKISPLAHAQFGPFRSLYLTPAQVREQYAGRTFVPVTDALTVGQLEELADLGPVVLLALAGTGTPTLSSVGLIRATLAAADHLPDAAVVVVPLAAHGDPAADHDLGVQVVGNYAQGDPVTGLTSVAADDPQADYPEDVAEIVDFDRPGPGKQGLVLFFTGLSGSGKSTLARALMDKVLEQGERTVTSLDGDVVRRNLSAGLTFSKADRETNIRRIGWVAAEIARHGGVAIVSPIAPFDETRQQVREMVEQAGGEFFLVHVATPLEECERRDRKGLYAKARRGEIPEFTGISSPYEEPTDATVRVDTTGRSIEDALDDVLVALAKTGHLDLTDSSPVEPSLVEEVAKPSLVEEVAKQPSQNQDEAEAPVETGVARPPQGAIKVLFVCTANICRSAFMEVTARHLAGDRTDIEFSSAGTHGFKDHALDEGMAAVLAAGVSHDDFTSRPVTRELIEGADVVLTAESTHRTFLLEEHPQAFRKVFTLAQFAEAAEASDLRGRDLIKSLGRQRGAARHEHDIADPYRRGPQASSEAAQRITGLLQTVIPALTGETH